MSKSDGGPAFPQALTAEPGMWVTGKDIAGMTLRDYFAAQFLTTVRVEDPEGVSAELVAQNCYRMADAMIAERAK